jgi:hypothetical protein
MVMSYRGLRIAGFYVEIESEAKLARPELFRLLRDSRSVRAAVKHPLEHGITGPPLVAEILKDLHSDGDRFQRYRGERGDEAAAQPRVCNVAAGLKGAKPEIMSSL